MAYFEDLSRCGYFSRFKAGAEKLKAVGWLAKGHPFVERQGEARETEFCQLLKLLQRPWEPGHFLGGHECEFCSESEHSPQPKAMWRYGLRIHFGVSNLFVPGKDCVYVAPSMIAHYVEAHAYDPPREFWEAVVNCPEMRSAEYLQALLAHGPSDAMWIESVQSTAKRDR